MYEVAAMRGNRHYIAEGIRQLNNYKIVLTEEEKQTITLKAKSWYDKLEAQRIAWGFPSFNNYAPNYETRIPSYLKDLDNPSGWGKQYYDYVYDGGPP